ncbi:solute carrier family 22 member 15-like [Lineus longissimus]|uniref:solute carrier family 22 member 15-like n=1 Tax=Lineus longissimus TaxID=88925 RepID=UPI002B4E0090
MDSEKQAEATTMESPGEKVGKPTYEMLLDTVGHFGLFQRITFSLLTLADVITSMIMMYLIFSSSTSNWRCAQFDGFNMTEITTGNETFEKTCLFNGSKCVEFDFDKDFNSIASEWNLVCDDAYIPKLTTSILMFGVLVGAFVFAQLSDLYGRRPVLISIIIALMISQVIVGTSINWHMHIAMRFCVGVFLGGTIGLCFVLPMEFIGPRWRSFCGALGLFDVGQALVAMFAYFERDWRYLAYTTGAISLPLVIAIVIYVPESCRWLIQKERFIEAEKVLRRMAKVNKTDVPDISLLKRISRAGKADDAAVAKYTYADLFSTRKYAVRTLVIMMSWFTASCVYYVIVVSISSLSGDMYLNTALSAIPSLFIGWSIIPVANWIGRKKAYLLYTAFPIVSMFAIVILQATGQMEEQGTLLTVLALVGKIGIGCSWIIAAIITAEVYPTLMRTVGVGIGNTTARFGGIIAPQIVYLGELIHWTVPYIINGSLALTSTILVMVLLPETAHKPLLEELPDKRATCCKCSKDDNKSERESDEELKDLTGSCPA